jgi:hypothetical protein
MIGLRSQQISFKEVFTTRVVNVYVNPFHTTTQFIETTRPLLSREFGINQNEIEIVPSGQYINGNPPEAAVALVPSSRRLCDIWGPQLRYLSFYVRRKNFVYPQIETPIRGREESHNPSSYDGECPICLETGSITRRYSCIHGLCSSCYGRCRSASIDICSLCRSH